MFAFHEANERSQFFLPYTRSAAKSRTEKVRGLGYVVDSRSPVRNMKVELDLPADQPPSRNRTNRRKGCAGSKARKRDITVEVELAQDLASLRSRKGGTGGMLWRAG